MRKLLEIKRSGITEREIYGAIAVSSENLEDDSAAADVTTVGDVVIFGRSLTKPYQMKAVYECLSSILSWPEKALSIASHSGELVHIEVAKSIIAESRTEMRTEMRAELREDSLELPPSPPLGGRTKESSVWTNPCSGKHAAILRACEVNGWPMKGYTELDHPYNQVYFALLESELGVSIKTRTIAKDGCLLPTVAMSVGELARLYSALARDRDADWIWEAAQRHPDLVGGHGRMDSKYLKVSPKIFAKEGADGLFGISLRLDDNEVSSVRNGKVGIVIKLAHGYDPLATEYLLQPILRHYGFDVPATAPPSGQQFSFTDDYRSFVSRLA